MAEAIRISRVGGPATCPLCWEDVDPGGDARVCDGCQVAYHAECFAELGGCATLACPSRTAPGPARAQRTADGGLELLRGEGGPDVPAPNELANPWLKHGEAFEAEAGLGRSFEPRAGGVSPGVLLAAAAVAFAAVAGLIALLATA